MKNTKRDLRSLHWTRRTFSAALATTFLGGSGLARAAAGATGPRVLLAGDSMIAGGFGVFLEQALRKEHGFRVHRRGKTSSGLARPDFFDWLKEAERLVAGQGPYDLNIVMFGGNDVQGLYMGRDTWIRWPDEGWSEEYARRIDAFCDIIAPSGQYIYWVGLPIMRPEKFRRRCEKVNAIFRERMAARERATFIDTWTLLADANGEYADRIVLDPPDDPNARAPRVRVRAGDGIHLSVAGAHHLKAYVLRHVLPVLSLM